MNVITRLVLAAVVCAVLSVAAQPGTAQASSTSNLVGNWQGILSAGQQKLRIEVKMTEPSTGQFAGTIDLPEAGVTNLPLEHLSYADRILSFDFNIGAPSRLEGVVSRDGTELVGSFYQAGNIIPLNLTHTDAKPDANVMKPAILSNPRRKLELQPCGVAGVTKDALCGQYEVYEDRAKNVGRKIKLNVMVLPALVDKPAPDPIFYLQGGPGGAATSVAAAWFLGQMHRTRDVVLVDQRGTGKSNPLPCNFRGDPNDMRGYFVEYLTPEAVRACRTELEKNADLRLYTTSIAMADLDDLRGTLGYGKINVDGGSYGSTTALSYLNFYPQHVRTVTISGVAPPENTLLVGFSRGVEHALNRLFDDCAADEKCKAAFPDLRKDWATVVANVTNAPATFDALNSVTRQKQQVTMTREGFAELVRLMLYVPNVMSIMPLMIHQMSQGDYSQFSYYAFQVQRGIDLALARGMQLSVFCAEDVPFIKESEIEPMTAGTFYGGSRARRYVKACEQWPHGEVPAKFHAPIKSDIPVLMLSGELDPVTPPDVATPLLRWLPNGRQIIMHNATHNSYECQEKLARDFIERGTAKDLDASCVEGIKRLPFLISLPALPIPK
jgi:pimeloyl-ACP methyl ester carboxylesterase